MWRLSLIGGSICSLDWNKREREGGGGPRAGLRLRRVGGRMGGGARKEVASDQ